MKTLKLVPSGWLCRYDEAPTGPFVWNENLCFKTLWLKGYNLSGQLMLIDEKTVVQPVLPVWIEE